MSNLQRVCMFALSILLLCIVNDRASAQSVPVYVSGGSTIYQVSGGKAKAILSVSGANFESIAMAPDTADVDSSGNALHAAILYACDSGGTIIRLDPTAKKIVPETIYRGSLSPECGRSTAAGDFYVSDKNVGGVYKFTGLINKPLGSTGAQTATPVSTAFPLQGRGITQKNNGDLLVVDHANGQVLRATYGSGFATLAPSSPFISALNSPVGIARISTGEVFVANGGAGQSVAHFNRDGFPATTCSSGLSFTGSQVPAFLAAAQSDTLFLVTSNGTAGTLWTWSPAQLNCSLAIVATTSAAITGVAVTPSAFVSIVDKSLIASDINPTPTIFNFNSNGFEITAKDCKATVTPYVISPATVSSMIAKAGMPNGSSPAINLGEAGFEVAYVAKWPSSGGSCGSVFADGAYVNQIFGVFDNIIVTNPRVVRCDGSANEPFLDANTTCSKLETIGVYPLGGIIPDDPATSVRGTSNSTFVLVNEAVLTGTQSGAGTFCGFQTPLNNTQNPSQAASFKLGTTNTINVKFKLANLSGSCQNGPYITNAKALISVGQIADANGNSLLNPLPLASTSVGNGDVQGLFSTGNQQYQFTLDTSGMVVGTYSLTVTFLSDNTVQQAIVFKITN